MQIFANNATSALASAVTASATTIFLAAGSGELFPSPAANQYFALTLNDLATGLLTEICYCTSRNIDTLTVIRAQEGTTAIAWSAGDLAANKITAGTLANFNQTIVNPTPLGYGKITNLTAAVGFSAISGGIPVGAAYAMVQSEGANVRWRDDGTAPTALLGMPIYAGASPLVFSNNLAAIKFIQVAPTATLDVSFYS